MNHSPNRTTDRLIEAARRSATVTDWTLDALAAQDIYSDEHTELELVSDTLPPLKAALAEFDYYSDGRPVCSEIVIEFGLHFGQTWPAEPTTSGERLIAEDRLGVDPGQPDRGGYRVYADPAACTLRVEELPPTPRLTAVR